MREAEQVSRRLKLRHLNMLIAVARTGSMVKAAEQLAVSQPVISKAIAELESIVGVRLLDRAPYGVEPTLHGRALLKRSVAIFDELRTTVGELEFLSDPTAGELRVGCEETLSTGLLPALIERLAHKYPRLSFEIAIADPRTLCERDLRGRKVEVAIMRIARAELEEEFETQTLYNDRLWVVAGIRNSSQATRSTAASVCSARMEMSPRLPMGVATRYSPALSFGAPKLVPEMWNSRRDSGCFTATPSGTQAKTWFPRG